MAMPSFTYTYAARDESGRLVRGVLEAESQVALAERLRRMGYLVTRMEQTAAGSQRLPGIPWGAGVSQESLLMAAVQLANVVGAGVPLVSSLRTIASQTPHRLLREALEAVARAIDGGETFSQALRRHAAVFPPLMISMVAVGEASGTLDTVLSRFATLVEKDLALRRAVQGSLTYPALLLLAATGLILFVVSFVVPQFASLFARVGVPLPLPTRWLSAVGNAITTSWWAFGLVGVAGVAGVTMASRLPRVRLAIDRGVLRLPAVGPVVHQTLVARFARMLATLVGAGLPILTALETAEGVVGNQVMVQEVRRVRSAVERGERIAETLAVGKVLAPDAIQMIRVGEESGRLETMLERIADFYELRVTYRLKQMTTLLEPIVLVGMGGLVALIMASLLLPMFDMVKVVQRGGLR